MQAMVSQGLSPSLSIIAVSVLSPASSFPPSPAVTPKIQESSGSSSSSGSSLGTMGIGLVAGGVVILTLMALVGLFVVKKRRASLHPPQPSMGKGAVNQHVGAEGSSDSSSGSSISYLMPCEQLEHPPPLIASSSKWLVKRQSEKLEVIQEDCSHQPEIPVQEENSLGPEGSRIAASSDRSSARGSNQPLLPDPRLLIFNDDASSFVRSGPSMNAGEECLQPSLDTSAGPSWWLSGGPSCYLKKAEEDEPAAHNAPQRNLFELQSYLKAKRLIETGHYRDNEPRGSGSRNRIKPLNVSRKAWDQVWDGQAGPQESSGSPLAQEEVQVSGPPNGPQLEDWMSVPHRAAFHYSCVETDQRASLPCGPHLSLSRSARTRSIVGENQSTSPCRLKRSSVTERLDVRSVNSIIDGLRARRRGDADWASAIHLESQSSRIAIAP